MHKEYAARRSLGFRSIYRARQLFFILLLPLIWLVVFKYAPMVGVQIAFRDFKIRAGMWGSEWIGVENFIKFFQSYQFSRVMKNTLVLSFYSLIAGFPLPIVLALALNALPSQRYKKFVQTLTYIPHFISTVVLVGMILQLFNPRIGLYGTFGRMLTGRAPNDILGSANVFPHLYVWSGIWQNMGWSSIIYMAALSAVDAQMHEAAQIDGAGRLQRCLHIDLPSILPTAVILLIMNAGSVMSVGFEKVYLMQNSLNLRASEVISTYVYKVSIQDGSDFSYGAAIGLFNSVVNLAMLALVNSIAKRVGETSLW